MAAHSYERPDRSPRTTHFRTTFFGRNTLFNYRGGGRGSHSGSSHNNNNNRMSTTIRHTLNSMPMLPSATPLEERLHQIVVFELRDIDANNDDNDDGRSISNNNGSNSNKSKNNSPSSSYNTMTLRALYNYVVETILDNCKKANQQRQMKAHMPAMPATRDLLSGMGGSGSSMSLSISSSTRSRVQFSRDTIVEDHDNDDHEDDEEEEKVQHQQRRHPHGRNKPTPSTNNNNRNNNKNNNNNHKSKPTKERLGGYLHPRDMRRLVTPFSSSNEPSLMIRRHVMLLNFDPLRAIVLKDRLLVLVPDGADSLILDLEKRMRGGIAEMENEVFGRDSNLDNDDGGDGNDNYKDGSGSGGKKTAPQSRGEESGAGSVFENIVKTTKKVFSRSIADGQNREGGGDDDDGDTNNYDPTETSSINDNINDDDNDNEWEELQDMDWSHMAFELQSVDAVLQTVTSMLLEDANKVHWRAIQSMAELRGDTKMMHQHYNQTCGVGGGDYKGDGYDSRGARGHYGGAWSNSGLNENAQERLRIHKDEINEMEGRVQGFVRAVTCVLDNDEDLSLMNLSRLLTHPDRFMQPVSRDVLHEESDEPELILEAYMQESLNIVNELDLLKGQITHTEEQISMMLDAIRNRLLYINTLLSVASLCVAVGSFVGSVFGMNLTNNMEDEENLFVKVTVGTVVGMFLLWFVLSWVFYRAANTSDLIKHTEHAV